MLINFLNGMLSELNILMSFCPLMQNYESFWCSNVVRSVQVGMSLWIMIFEQTSLAESKIAFESKDKRLLGKLLRRLVWAQEDEQILGAEKFSCHGKEEFMISLPLAIKQARGAGKFFELTKAGTRNVSTHKRKYASNVVRGGINWYAN